MSFNHKPVLDAVGVLERWGHYMLRPTLHLEHCGDRAVETVAVTYPLGYYDPFDSAGSTASGSFVGAPSQRNRRGHSRYIRVRVRNLHGYPARQCRVFVDRILLNGKIIERERSPLHWMDYGDVFEWPLMRWGSKDAWYVDLCAADEIDPHLQIISYKGLKRGYLRFRDSGIYTIELSAEALKPCSFGRMVLNVRHDGKDWRNLQVISAKEGRKWIRLFNG